MRQLLKKVLYVSNPLSEKKMSKFNQKQAKRNFVIQIYYPEEEIPIKSTIIITENCSLLALILFACS